MNSTKAADRKRSKPQRLSSTKFPLIDKHQETLRKCQDIGIFDENDSLKAAVVWGSAGIESYLNQFLPPEKSLFFDYMDVEGARKEGGQFVDVLLENGVNVVEARKEIANSLAPLFLDGDQVLHRLIKRAEEYQEQYGIKRPDYKKVIERLLAYDCMAYGEQQAYALNQLLSLDHIPMGNLIYSRDHMNVVLGRLIRSVMKEPIRKPEVDIYRAIYEGMLGLAKKVIEIPPRETFEGGDIYIHDGVVYCGVGSRTTTGAAVQIYKELHEELEQNHFKFAIVLDEKAQGRPHSEQMGFMHLDTWSYPIGHHEMEIYPDEAMRRRLLFVKKGKNGKIVLCDTEMSFFEYLNSIGEKLYTIPLKEQQKFGCNNLSLDNNTIIVPIGTNDISIDLLNKAGKKVLIVPLYENTRGYGAAHCMTGQLSRRK